jgi:hypothetical protein
MRSRSLYLAIFTCGILHTAVKGDEVPAGDLGCLSTPFLVEEGPEVLKQPFDELRYERLTEQ